MKNLLLIFLLLPMFMFSQMYKPKKSEIISPPKTNKHPNYPNSYGQQSCKGVSDDNTFILDGFQTWYSGFGEICRRFFVIHNQIVFSYHNEGCNDWNGLFGLSSEDISEFDLEPMIKLFLKDLYNSIERTDGSKINTEYIERVKIFVDFQELSGSTLGVSSGMNDDENIRIKIDPSKWVKSTSLERWYTIYHELGHDVLNFKHGEGGKMMFNYTFKEYSWSDFENDKQYMFESYIRKLNKLKTRLN